MAGPDDKMPKADALRALDVARPTLFVSSTFTEAGVRLQIRDDLLETYGRDSQTSPIWMAEIFQPIAEGTTLSPFHTAEFCVEGVRRCRVFVAILTHKVGSAVPLANSSFVGSSFFELELFAAALHRKPSYIFCLDGFEPSVSLARLLDLLAPALHGFEREPMSSAAIQGRIAHLLEQYSGRQPVLRPVPDASELITRIGAARTQPYDVEGPPGFRFLAERFVQGLAPPDPKGVADVLERVRGERDNHTRITLLWMALRNLMGAPYMVPANRGFLEIWDDALSLWNSAAAWYGLHGHPYMGCLSALGSVSRIRANLAQDARAARPAPDGALASEYYSLARKAKASTWRAGMLDTSRRHVDRALARIGGAGEYQLRGSVRRLQGDREGAIEDYERALQLRLASGAGPAQRGESESELGYALLGTARRREGLELLEQGAGRLTPDDGGFYVRALRKLAIGYLRTLSPLRALSTLDAAMAHAEAVGLLDQISRIEALSIEASRMLALTRRRR
jgi:tetratricopeptide (TPR) repeat protein